MRVQKVAANGDTFRWHYDAQMPVEETRVASGQTTVMRNIVGPRGNDVQFDGSNVAFPLYDTHGNAKALLARSGSTFTTSFWRQYDAWGSLRTGSALGGASQRYCANMGHVTDDESGLIYMRARFYESWTGRFVSEDPVRDGANWFLYCSNSPLSFIDQDGLKVSWPTVAAVVFVASLLNYLTSFVLEDNRLGNSVASAIIGVIMGGVVKLCEKGVESALLTIDLAVSNAIKKLLVSAISKFIITPMALYSSPEVKAAEKSLAGPAVIATSQRTSAFYAIFFAMELESLMD